MKPRATIQKRRFLRQNGLRKADVDGIGLALLDTWARAQAKIEILDAYFSEHGLLEEDGKPQPALVHLLRRDERGDQDAEDVERPPPPAGRSAIRSMR